MSAPASILVVEDEALIALDLKFQLQDMGHRVIGMAASAEQAYAFVERERPDLILMDIHIKGAVDGIEVAMQLNRFDGVPVIFVTANSDAATMARTGHAMPISHVFKPFKHEELRAAVDDALAHTRAS